MDSAGVLSNTQEQPRRDRPFLVRARRQCIFDCQPAVPILSETRLQLDLLFSHRVLDLGAVAQVILGDLGATLQVLRLTAPERASSERTEFRIEDWVVHLGRESLRRNLKHVLPSVPQARRDAVRRVWHSARIIAELSAQLAIRRCDVRPREAYLAGLLCEIGRLPGALEWVVEDINLADAVTVGRTLAIEWGVPNFVGDDLGRFSKIQATSCAIRQIVETARVIAREITNAEPRRNGKLVSRTPKSWGNRAACNLSNTSCFTSS